MNMFDKQSIAAGLHLFAPGMINHITPIRYEMVTPDMSLLAFRTTGKDGNEYYFSLLEFDHVSSIRHIKKVIGKQFGKVIDFLPPTEKQKGRTELEQKSARIEKRGVSYVLARTERPKGAGYWATYIQVMPGDDINQKLASLNEQDQLMAKKAIAEVIKHYAPSTDCSDFMSSWQAKTKQLHKKPEEISINETNYGMNVFKNVTGNWEIFYNTIKIPDHRA